MKKISLFLVLLPMLLLAACNNNGEENNSNSEETNDVSGETIVFGQTPWSSTAPPTEIAKQILEEQGYEVIIETLDQPFVWQGMAEREIDFFMDAWLPTTEADRWDEYQDELVKVATSYENADIGWAVPTYVSEDSMDDLIENADEYENQVLAITEGAGIVDLSHEMIEGKKLEDKGLEMTTSSEGAMFSVVRDKIANEEPVVFTAWRPHSIFAEYDLKFLEGQDDYFEADNVYVLSYEGIEEEYPLAYDILSNWSIPIDELEEMIYENEENDVSFEQLASDWIDDNRDKVDQMIEG